MALPTSTIAFAIATCIPFGIAIFDKKPGAEVDDAAAARRDPYDDEHEDLDRDRKVRDDVPPTAPVRETVEPVEPVEPTAVAVDEGKQAEKLAAIFGAAKATFGGVFTGVKLGTPIADLEAKRDAIDKFFANGELDIDQTNDVLRSFKVSAYGLCDQLQDHLATTWGVAKLADGRRYWSSDKMRVVLDSSAGCDIRFEQYAPLDRWIAKTASSVVPVLAIGRTDIDLLSEIKHRSTVRSVTSNDAQITWQDLGAGNGLGTTQFTATIEKGKIANIEARVDISPDTNTALVERLKALYGASEEIDGVMTWKKPALTYDNAGVLSVGDAAK